MSAPVRVFPLVRQSRMRARSTAHLVTWWRLTGDPAAAQGALEAAVAEAERQLVAEGVPENARRAALGAFRRDLEAMADRIASGQPPARGAR